MKIKFSKDSSIAKLVPGQQENEANNDKRRNKWKKTVEKRDKGITHIVFENQYKSKGNFMKTFIWKKTGHLYIVLNAR